MSAVSASCESLSDTIEEGSAAVRCWKRVADQSLLARLRTGDNCAYQQLILSLSPRMTAVALRILRSEHDAADAVQEAFISAFQSLERFDGQSLLSTWIHRILVNTCLMQLRRRRRRPECSLNSLDAELVSARRPPGTRCVQSSEDSDQRSEAECDAMRMIESLPARYREVVMTRIVDGYNTRSASHRLRTTESIVKTRLHRARRLLREMRPAS